MNTNLPIKIDLLEDISLPTKIKNMEKWRIYDSTVGNRTLKGPDKPGHYSILNIYENNSQCILTWGENVYVKIPETNTKNISCANLIKKLTREGIKLNITAILTLDQVNEIVNSLKNGSSAYVSVFAGRIADAGIDPIWFGIFAVIVVEFGLISPPVGMNLFVIKGVMQKTPLQTIWFGTLPFLFTDMIRLALIIAFPAICLFLPSLMMS